MYNKKGSTSIKTLSILIIFFLVLLIIYITIKNESKLIYYDNVTGVIIEKSFVAKNIETSNYPIIIENTTIIQNKEEVIPPQFNITIKHENTISTINDETLYNNLQVGDNLIVKRYKDSKTDIFQLKVE